MRAHPTLITSNREYAIGLARAFGGALVFGLPLLMTMEMWALGFYVHPGRLVVFLLVNLFVLIGLSRFGGFERTAHPFEDVLDALAAVAVAVVTSAAVLALFGILTPDMRLDEIAGKVAIQAVPCSFGAMLARKQFGEGERRDDVIQARRTAGHAGQLFLMFAGALFLAFNVSPTEEMILISYKMSPWQAFLLVLLSIALLDAFVYGLGFAEQPMRPEGMSWAGSFLRFSLAGYGIALIVSFYVLWTFGRADGIAPAQLAMIVVVLAFPAAVGAAIARLVV
jgi:putative integral membrane protein (TIGR02587 family)